MNSGRKFGIDIIGDVPWGTHLCQFYHTKQDLLDILVPYFKAGLENNEFCMWVTSEPLGIEDAKKALKGVIRNLEDYIKKGQIEVVDYSEWYTKSGEFDGDRVWQGWLEKEKLALEKGFEGLRLTGNTFWLEAKDWRDFSGYEAKIDSVISNYRMLAICTYSLDKCGIREVLDVASNHRFAVIKRADRLEVVESAERKRVEEMLRESEERHRTLFERTANPILVIDTEGNYVGGNKAALQFLECTQEELLTKNVRDTIPPGKDVVAVMQKHIPLWESGGRIETEYYVNGKLKTLDLTITPGVWQGKQVVFGVGMDITERKKAEEALQESEERYRSVVERANDGICIIQDGMIKYLNPRLAAMWGGTIEGFIDTSFVEYLSPDNVLEIADRYKRRVAGEDVTPIYQITLVLRDGRKLYAEVNAAVITYRGKPADLVVLRDITERKQAEETLRESEERYRSLVDNAAEGISVVQDAIIKFSNRKLTEITGYSVDEMSYMPTEKLIHPEDLDRVRQYHAQRMKGGKAPSTYSLRIVDKEGNVKWLERNVATIIWQDKPAGLVFDTDITERKQVEKLSSVLINSSPIGIYIIQGRKFKLVNPTFQKIVGYTENELVDMDPFNIVHPEDREMVRENAVRMLRGERSSPYEYRYIRKSGESRWVAEQVVSVEYQGNRATLGSFMDITERKLVEEVMRQSEERYRTIFDEMNDAYFEVDLAGNFTFANDSMYRSAGYSAEELIGMSYRLVTSKDDINTVYKAFNQVYRTGKPCRDVPYKIARSDGSTRFVEVSAFPLRNEVGEIVGFRGIGRDITDRRKAKEEQRQLELKAQVASRLASVGEMAAGVAHEINNPLTGVIGYAQLLVDREDVPFDIRKDLSVINEGAQRVAGIVKRLLTFSRQTKSERKYVDINELIENTLALRDYHLKVNNIKVITQMAPDLPETVADPGQMQQVLLNLIVNAETEMKLAHGKGKLAITTEKSDNTIKICVKDDGPGIKPEVIDKIFNPFFTTREVGQGTGLGLSLCYGIIAEHKGRIYAESKAGKGATFIVELPVVIEAELPELAEPVMEQPEKVAKARILVVDDEKVIRDLAKRALVGEGYEVDTVDNAADALKKIEGQRYNLILLDIKMPGMDGAELYRRIQKIAKSLARRVILITGDMLSTPTEKFLSQTKVAHLDKPFNAEQLRREVKRALTGGR